MKKLILTAILIALASLAHADYHYAGHEGTNEYPYNSWETAADSIQLAVDASSPHDTVYIGAGEWYQYMGTEEYDSVAIIGMGTDITFCYNDLIHPRIFYIDYGCSVEDISFFNASTAACVSAGVYAGVSIKDCKFFNSRYGIVAGGYPTYITNCYFDSCGMAIASLVWIGNLYISNNIALNCYTGDAFTLRCNSAIVENNIIINPQGSWEDGISGSFNVDGIIRNNVVINGYSGIAANASLEYSNAIRNFRNFGTATDGLDSLFNNSISNCTEGIEIVSTIEASNISYNNFWNNDVDIANYGNPFDSVGNIFYNPMYISESNHDYHLQSFSPLIDAGHPEYLDVDGSRSDIGAYGGPFGESYEYQDLAPSIPDSIIGAFVEDSIIIQWRYNTEADFSHYQLHRDTITGFEPSVFNRIAEPESSYYSDLDIINGYSYYYRIASVDSQDNISDYSSELEIVTTGIWGQSGVALPKITEIRTNYPNPFNFSTTIVYSVANLGPIPAEIEIVIYDITGSKVRTLVNERKDLGEHSIIWDGCDDRGNDCSTGVYFAKISQWGLSMSGKPRKLVLVK